MWGLPPKGGVKGKKGMPNLLGCPLEDNKVPSRLDGPLQAGEKF